MKILITGGLGFIGINATLFFSKENEVYIIDNFSRKGCYENLEIIKKNKNIKVYESDIRNHLEVNKIFSEVNPDVVIHLAGQVAVTTSIKNPREDFEINSLGTLNILESIRNYCPNSILIFSSTNKVYGEYKNKIIETETRYKYENILGVDESTPLNLHSPYGCSKGSADQYVRDYSRIYGLKTVVLRQSCIYGPNQFGIEDQGWIAWFLIASTFNKHFYVYGNGKQVRDILFVDDLIELFDLVIKNIDLCYGEIFNVGGGPENSISLLEFLEKIKTLKKSKLSYDFNLWRPGDQKIYVSDLSKINMFFNWSPKHSIDEGILILNDWVVDNKIKLEKLNLI